MDFKGLVNRINDISGVQRLAEGVTLAQVAAAEKTAADAATAKKAGGGWGGLTSWDPKTAGDIAVAQLADQNGLPGLFNSKGEFVVASSKRMDGQTGEKPQIAPPTPSDWEPLQKLGLVPPNAQGPAGLTNFLSGGKANQEFDQVKTASDKVNQDRATDELRAGATERSDAFAKEKIEQLNALVAQLEKTAPATAPAQSGQAASGPVSWKQIYDMNKDVIGSNPNIIKPGQELKLPNGSTYTVKAGDNLSKIAKSLKESVYKFNIAESLLADMDSILENALTAVGKNLPAKGGTSVVKGSKGAADDVIDVVARDVTPKPGSKINKGKVAATAAGVAGAGAVGYGVATGKDDKAAPAQSGQATPAAPIGAGAGRGKQGGPTAAELAQAQKAPAQSGQKANPAGGTPAQSGQAAAKPTATPEQQQIVGQIQSVMGELADIEDPAVQAALANARRVLDKYGIPE